MTEPGVSKVMPVSPVSRQPVHWHTMASAATVGMVAGGIFDILVALLIQSFGSSALTSYFVYWVFGMLTMSLFWLVAFWDMGSKKQTLQHGEHAPFIFGASGGYCFSLVAVFCMWLLK